MGVLFGLWFLMVSALMSIGGNFNTIMPFQNQLGEYYSLVGLPKAKGVNLKIKIPKGWEVKEGDRPNIVVKFVNGADTYLVQVNEAPTFFSKNQSRELFTDQEYIDGLKDEYSSLIKNLRIFNEKLVTIDNYPALEFELTGTMERVGTSFKCRMKIWQILYEDRFIILQGGIFGNVERPIRLELFHGISNSVILPDQYSTP